MKKNIVLTVLSGFILFCLFGCQNQVKTIEYYSNHLDEAKARVAKCEKEGRLNENQERDCSNAYNAVYKTDLKYFGEKIDKVFKDIFEQ